MIYPFWVELTLVYFWCKRPQVWTFPNIVFRVYERVSNIVYRVCGRVSQYCISCLWERLPILYIVSMGAFPNTVYRVCAGVSHCRLPWRYMVRLSRHPHVIVNVVFVRRRWLVLEPCPMRREEVAVPTEGRLAPLVSIARFMLGMCSLYLHSMVCVWEIIV